MTLKARPDLVVGRDESRHSRGLKDQLWSMNGDDGVVDGEVVEGGAKGNFSLHLLVVVESKIHHLTCLSVSDKKMGENSLHQSSLPSRPTASY